MPTPRSQYSQRGLAWFCIFVGIGDSAKSLLMWVGGWLPVSEEGELPSLDPGGTSVKKTVKHQQNNNTNTYLFVAIH